MPPPDTLMCVPLAAWSGQTTPIFDDLLVFGLVRAHQAGDVIGVGDRHAAFAGGDGLDLVGVAALGRACEVGHDAARPGFGLRFAHGGR
jgi:hypothetical protein